MLPGLNIGLEGVLSSTVVWEGVEAWRSYQELREKVSKYTSFETGEASQAFY